MILRIRISPQIKDKIKDKADSNGLSLSAYIRLAALNYEPSGSTSKITGVNRRKQEGQNE